MQRFIRFLLISGVLPASALTVAVSLQNQPTLVDIGLVSLAGTIIIGLPLATVAYAYTSHVGRRAATAGFFLFMMPIASAVMTRAAYEAVHELPYGRWQALPAPPEPIVSLAGPTCYHREPLVYARAQSGHVYRIATEPGAAWQRSLVVPDKAIEPHSECWHPNATTTIRSPRPPGRVVISHEIMEQGIDSGTHFRHVLLEDGSIQRWTRNYDIYQHITAMSVALMISLVSALSTGFIVVFGRSPLGWPRRVS